MNSNRNYKETPMNRIRNEKKNLVAYYEKNKTKYNRNRGKRKNPNSKTQKKIFSIKS